MASTPTQADAGGKHHGMNTMTLVAVLAAFSLFTMGGTFAAVKYAVPRNAGGPAPAASEAPHRLNPTYPLDEFIVNLGDPSERRFLKTSITLEIEVPGVDLTRLSGEGLAKAIEEFRKDEKVREGSFKDAVIEILSRKSAREAASTQGKAAIKSELIKRVGELLPGEEKVTQIFFTDYIVQ